MIYKNEEIYVHKKLEPICKKSISTKLFYKLATECSVSPAGKCQRQVDAVSKGGTLSGEILSIFYHW